MDNFNGLMTDIIIVKTVSSLDGELWLKLQDMIKDSLQIYETDYCKLEVYKTKSFKTIENDNIGMTLAGFVIKLEEDDEELRQEQLDYIASLDSTVKEHIEGFSTDDTFVQVDVNENPEKLMFNTESVDEIKNILSSTADDFINAFEQDFKINQRAETKLYFKTCMFTVMMRLKDEDWDKVKSTILTTIEKEKDKGVHLLYMNHSGLTGQFMRNDMYFVVLYYLGLTDSDLLKINDLFINTFKNIDVDLKILTGKRYEYNINTSYNDDELMSCQREYEPEIKKSMSELSNEMFSEIKKEVAKEFEEKIDKED